MEVVTNDENITNLQPSIDITIQSAAAANDDNYDDVDDMNINNNNRNMITNANDSQQHNSVLVINSIVHVEVS